MIEKANLKGEMRALFESLSEFRLELDDELELIFTPYSPGRGTTTIERHQDMSEVSRTPLAHGPNCEFYVVLTDSWTESPMPADPRRLLISWRVREAKKGESSNIHKFSSGLQLSPYERSATAMTSIYSVDEYHVCEAWFFYYRPRLP